MADRQMHGQALRDADLTLRLAAVTATGSLQQERAAVTRIVTPSLALRALAATPSALDGLRRSAGLDYLVVVRDRRVATSSIALPSGLHQDAAAVERGGLRSVSAERRMIIRRSAGASVLGGLIWRPALAGLDVRAAFVVDGTSPSNVPAGARLRSTPNSANGVRVVCLCGQGPTPRGDRSCARRSPRTIWGDGSAGRTSRSSSRGSPLSSASPTCWPRCSPARSGGWPRMRRPSRRARRTSRSRPIRQPIGRSTR